MPRPSDRELHKYLHKLAVSREEVTGDDLFEVIEWHNRAAVLRCKECQYNVPKQGKDDQ